jgi:hypothetical protein
VKSKKKKKTTTTRKNKEGHISVGAKKRGCGGKAKEEWGGKGPQPHGSLRERAIVGGRNTSLP